MVVKVELPDVTTRIKEHVKEHKTAYLIATYAAIAAVVYYVVKDIPPDANENQVTVNFITVLPQEA